jgi:hypothetical protein
MSTEWKGGPLDAEFHEERRRRRQTVLQRAAALLGAVLCTTIGFQYYARSGNESRRESRLPPADAVSSAPALGTAPEGDPDSPPSGVSPQLLTDQAPRREAKPGAVAPLTVAATGVEKVEYKNPETGAHSEYDLEVDRDSEGRIERVNFPNGGWQEIEGDPVDNGDGTETFTDSQGREYTIHRPDPTVDAGEDTDNDDTAKDDEPDGE